MMKTSNNTEEAIIDVMAMLRRGPAGILTPIIDRIRPITVQAMDICHDKTIIIQPIATKTSATGTSARLRRIFLSRVGAVASFSNVLSVLSSIYK